MDAAGQSPGAPAHWGRYFTHCLGQGLRAVCGLCCIFLFVLCSYSLLELCQCCQLGPCTNSLNSALPALWVGTTLGSGQGGRAIRVTAVSLGGWVAPRGPPTPGCTSGPSAMTCPVPRDPTGIQGPAPNCWLKKHMAEWQPPTNSLAQLKNCSMASGPRARQSEKTP